MRALFIKGFGAVTTAAIFINAPAASSSSSAIHQSNGVRLHSNPETHNSKRLVPGQNVTACFLLLHRCIVRPINTPKVTDADSGDGAKRTNARIVITNGDGSAPTPINLRTIYIYVEDLKIIAMIAYGAEGKSVSAQVDISAKPW